MARSKPKYRQSSEKPKKGTSCPCIQDEQYEPPQQQPTESRLTSLVTDMYQPNDEFVDLESFSESSSFGVQIDPLELGTAAGIGDQFEETTTYLSGGNLSSGIDQDSEPTEEGSVSFENRKLNIAATVMSWLDNYNDYGQERGYRLSSNRTSLMIQKDQTSRIDSSSILDIDDAESNLCPPKILDQVEAGPTILQQQLTILEKACSTLMSLRNDLEPLSKNLTNSPVNWENIQQVLSTWANLMSTIWKRSQEGNVSRGELYSFCVNCENLESLVCQVTPMDISRFGNPVVKLNLGKTQGIVNLASKWAKEIMTLGKMEDFNLGVTSWTDSMKVISTIVNDQLKQITVTFAKSLLDNCIKFTSFPKYELILFDVIPSKTSSGWMFFGKVELRRIEDQTKSSEDETTKQIDVKSIDSGLSIKFCGIVSRNCIDYSALFHVACRSCFECKKYYEKITSNLLKAEKYLKESSLIPESSCKNFDKISTSEQGSLMNSVFAQICADQIMDSTITAMDEILRSFNLLIVYTVRTLKRFLKNIKNKKNQVSSHQNLVGSPFKELVVPLEQSNTLFQTIRRFLSLGPMTSPGSTTWNNNNNTVKINRIEVPDSLLNNVNSLLEEAINSLYTSSSSNIFTFQHGIQCIFAISQLKSEPEFEKKAVLESRMKYLVLHQLNGLAKANKSANSTFKRVVHLLDSQIKVAEKHIDVMMKKATGLGMIVPARTSGVSFSHRHGGLVLLRYSRNSYIRHQAKQLRHTNEVHRHTRKYIVEPDYEDDTNNSSQ